MVLRKMNAAQIPNSCIVTKTARENKGKPMKAGKNSSGHYSTSY